MSRVVNGLGAGLSNEWGTPKFVFDALGVRFDLDVCAPVDGPLHTPCAAWFSDSALERDWSGFVWMNPPFGGRNGMDPWLEKFFLHGNGVALTPDRTSSAWFHFAYEKCDALLLTRGRTNFLRHDGTPAGSPAFGTALWASGEAGVSSLKSASENGLGILILKPGAMMEARK